MLQPDWEKIEAFEAEADQIFGDDSRPMRCILGCTLGDLSRRAGLTAVRAYIEKALAALREMDPTEVSPDDVIDVGSGPS